MSFASGFLSRLDQIRSLPARLGLHPFTVAIVRKVKTRDEPHGRYENITISTPITLADGYAPHVRLLSSRDLLAHPDYQAGDYRIGPLTPEYPDGGVALTDLNPALGSTETEVYYQLTGPGLRSGGELFRKIKTETASTLHYFVVVRRADMKAL